MVEGKSSQKIRAQSELYTGEYEGSMTEVAIAYVARIRACLARFVAFAAVRPVCAGERLFGADGVGNFAEAGVMGTTERFGAKGEPKHA